MIDSHNLKDRIDYFIQTVGQVEMAQIQYMFRAYDPHNIENSVSNLISSGRAVRENTMITRFSGIRGTEHHQKMLTRAAWILCHFGAREILAYYIAEYPFQIFFILKTNVSYDVVAITPQSAFSLEGAAKRVAMITSVRTPSGKQVDPTRHIALLIGQGDPKKLITPDFFDYCATVEDNKVNLIPTKSFRTGRKKKGKSNEET